MAWKVVYKVTWPIGKGAQVATRPSSVCRLQPDALVVTSPTR
jgi:hypothetical protein